MDEDTVIIGVDNGISGGLCAVAAFNGAVIAYRAMPTKMEAGKSEVDVRALLDWLEPYRNNMVVCVEEPLKHAKSSQAMRSMSISFGLIIGACEAKRFEVRRVQVKEWQDAVLGKRLAKGMTKVAALAIANKLWTSESWLATSKSKVPHDGIIDAALIAHYSRDRQLL
jgi:hypothetical protein